MSFLSSCGVFLEDGFTYAILAMGYYISYTILDFPDLTVEGTVLSGGVTYAMLARAGVNPWFAIVVAFAVGVLFGSITGILHVKLKIRPLLCGILVSTALISVNLVASVLVMGGNFRGEEALTTIPVGRNVPTILNTFPCNLIPMDFLHMNLRKIIAFLIVALIFKGIMDLFLKTKAGLLLRATGNNESCVAMLAQNPGKSKILGLALGNGFASVTGALIVQSRGNANQSMGIGMIVIGLASLIIGTSVFKRVRFLRPSSMVIIGSVIYQACLALATAMGIPTSYNKLIMALLFTLALVLSDQLKRQRGGSHAKS